MPLWKQQIAAAQALPVATREMILSAADEDGKMRQYAQRVLNLPLGKYRAADVRGNRGNNGEDSSQHLDCALLQRARETMDANVAGNQPAKLEVLKVLAQTLSAGAAPTVMALEGPPGCGKTTLAQTALAEALGRPFCHISLGGASDATTLGGHNFTYQGAQPGRIASEISRVGCLDPVIFFDELDKVSDTTRGDELVNLLVHICDPVQNDCFVDSYFGPSLPLDLSKAILVFSWNDRAKISRVLLNRFHIVRCESPDTDTRFAIAENHFVPRALRSVQKQEEDQKDRKSDGPPPPLARFTDAAVRDVVKRTESDDGVRSLERSIQHIIKIINLAIRGGSAIDGLLDLSHVLPTDARTRLPVTVTPELCATILDSRSACERAGTTSHRESTATSMMYM